MKPTVYFPKELFVPLDQGRLLPGQSSPGGICLICRQPKTLNLCQTTAGVICPDCAEKGVIAFAELQDLRDSSAWKPERFVEYLRPENRSIRYRATVLLRLPDVLAIVLRQKPGIYSMLLAAVSANIGFRADHPLALLVRQAAKKACIQLGAAIIPHLLNLKIPKSDPEYGINRLQILGRLAPEKPEVQKILEAGAKDDRQDVRDAVLTVVRRLQGRWAADMLKILTRPVIPPPTLPQPVAASQPSLHSPLPQSSTEPVMASPVNVISATPPPIPSKPESPAASKASSVLPKPTPAAQEEPRQPPGQLILDAERLIIRLQGQDQLKRASLEKFARPISASSFSVDYTSFMQNCNYERELKAKIGRFRNLIATELPPIWEEFLASLVRKLEPFIMEHGLQVYTVKPDRELLTLLAQDQVLQKYVIRAENYRILIARDNFSKVEKRLRQFGYLLNGGGFW
jgi:hypothetical protein